jgi:hypothetical protein
VRAREVVLEAGEGREKYMWRKKSGEKGEMPRSLDRLTRGCRYYLNGMDAYRLKLLLPLTEEQEALLRLKEETAAMEEELAGASLDGVSRVDLQPIAAQ